MKRLPAQILSLALAIVAMLIFLTGCDSSDTGNVLDIVGVSISAILDIIRAFV